MYSPPGGQIRVIYTIYFFSFGKRERILLGEIEKKMSSCLLLFMNWKLIIMTKKRLIENHD